MNSESTFTASSGHHCNYEVIVEDGRASANVVWLGQAATPEDILEFERFITEQADQAGFPHTGAENFILGQIQPKDLPRVREIVEERVRDLKPDDHQ